MYSQLKVNCRSSQHGITTPTGRRIGLVTVFDAILTSWQPRENLQCLYENLMSNNFRKTPLLKKKLNGKLKLHSKGFYQQILWTFTMLKFHQTLAFDFPYICLQFFSENFSRKEEKFLQTNV